MIGSENTRLDFTTFIEVGSRAGGYFDKTIIWTCKFLEEINIKEGWEKEEFIRYFKDFKDLKNSRFCRHPPLRVCQVQGLA